MELLSNQVCQTQPNSSAVYVRHRPETTLLYQIVHEYWPEFWAELASHGKYLPAYVTKEFDEYLKSGILEHGVKGGRWFSLIDKVYADKTLLAAWQRVAKNRGAVGVDKVSVNRFNGRASEYLKELSEELCNGRFRPQPVRRVHIPKAGGKTRPLGIPTVKDRIVQTALKMVLEPIFENEFHPSSYGFRPGRGCKNALREVDGLLKEGFTWVVDTDLAGYFDSIPHERMLSRVQEQVSDGRVLDLLRLFIENDIVEGMQHWTPARGTPQGAVISPLLANLYLHPLDKLVSEEYGARIVRYADDFVILCRSQQEAMGVLEVVQQWVTENGLTLYSFP